MDDPGDRGALIIRPRVYERLAERAALSIDDVLAQSTGISAAFDDQTDSGAALYRRLPRAVSHDDGAAITVSVAVRWPSPVNQVCARLGDVVSDDVLRYTGGRPARVDVEVAQLVSGEPERRRNPAPIADAGAPALRSRAGFIDLPPARVPESDGPVGRTETVDLTKAEES